MFTTARLHMRGFRKSSATVTQHQPGRLTRRNRRGGFGEEYFGLVSTYFQGRAPKSVNFYWRRFRVADMPLDDPEAFGLWLRDQWYQKDALMEEYVTTGRFPRMVGDIDHIETEIKTRSPWELLQIASVVGTVVLIWYNVRKTFWSISSVLG